jgi:hypothetical protein
MTTAECRGRRDHVMEDRSRAELAGRSWGLEEYNSFAGGDDVISLNTRSSMIGSVCIVHIVLNWKTTGNYKLGRIWKDVVMVFIRNYLSVYLDD